MAMRRSCVFLSVLCSAPVVYLLLGYSGEHYSRDGETLSSEYSGDSPQVLFSLHLNQSFAVQTGPVSFLQIVEDPANRFSMRNTDVIVVLHIQKTAGTSFEKFLVHHLETESPCDCSTGRKRCYCKRVGTSNQLWLFSRYSTGWACGLHADYTELFASGCVSAQLDRKEGVQRERRFFGTTFLRDPISRTISEFRHVNRGATWMASRHLCNGRPPTSEEMPPCYDVDTGWDGVSLDEFLSCPHNLAFNRQTRMLADLTLVGCYSNKLDVKERDRILIESAKENLRKLAFFGLKERMDDSQYMFYRLFGLRFTKRLSDWKKSKSNDTVVTQEQLERIRLVNHLDIELYDYAVTLFEQRIAMLRQRYPGPDGEVEINGARKNDSVTFRRKTGLLSDEDKAAEDSDGYDPYEANDSNEEKVEFDRELD